MIDTQQAMTDKPTSSKQKATHSPSKAERLNVDTSGLSGKERAELAESLVKPAAKRQGATKNVKKVGQIKKPVQIYALFDPRGGGIRYIGKANDAQKRLKGHLRETRRVTPLYCWISKLRDEGVTPWMAVIAHAISADWEDLERDLITQWREDGMRLLNVAEGGDEPYCPPEVRAENGRKVAASIAADPIKKRIWHAKRALGAYIRDPKISEEAKERMRVKMRMCAAKRPDLFGSWANV